MTLAAYVTMLGALRASALLVFLGSVSAQFCEPCSYYASMSDVTTGCSGYCHCGTCGTGRINNIEYVAHQRHDLPFQTDLRVVDQSFVVSTATVLNTAFGRCGGDATLP